MTESGDTYIHPVGWEKFQHGVKRGYPWIKVYPRLLANPRYLELSLRHRGLLQGLWFLYHESGGEVVASPGRLGAMLGDSTLQRRDLERLNHAGFIAFSASPRSREESREEHPPVVPPPRRKSSKSASPPARPATTATSTQVARREPNPGWDFLIEIGGEPLEKQKPAYGRVSADLNELAKRELNGATPDEYLDLFRRRRQALVDEWGEGKATIRSLVNNWQLAKRLAESRGRPAGPPSLAHRALERANQLRQEGR